MNTKLPENLKLINSLIKKLNLQTKDKLGLFKLAIISKNIEELFENWEWEKK